jgi:hypothetical protein
MTPSIHANEIGELKALARTLITIHQNDCDDGTPEEAVLVFGQATQQLFDSVKDDMYRVLKNVFDSHNPYHDMCPEALFPSGVALALVILLIGDGYVPEVK